MTEPLGCGSCNFCCRWMAVDDLEPPKPEGKWCVHARPGSGCGVYDSRPQSCRDFSCMWLQSQARSEDERWPIEMRPDRCKVMVVPHKEDLVLKVDPGRPDAHKREPIATFVRKMLRLGVHLYLGIGGKHYQIKEKKN